MAEFLARSVPFIANHAGRPGLRVGDVLCIPKANHLATLQSLLERHLSIGLPAQCTSRREGQSIIAEQYSACLDYIFASSTWEMFRTGDGKLAALAYLVETRHYLHAAASRMSSSVAASSEEPKVSASLCKHLIEEADHSKFFESGLELLNISSAVIAQLRPHPTTIEWILVMRAMGHEDPLAGALCSGLMESSASDRTLVTNWHEMLVHRQLLSADVVKNIQQHVELDEHLGHGENWRHIVAIYGKMENRRLVRALNSVSIAAEATRNWSDALQHSCIGPVAALASPKKLCDDMTIDPCFAAEHIWSAKFLASLVESNPKSGYATALTAAYALPEPKIAFEAAPDIATNAELLRERCGVSFKSSSRSLLDQIDSWLCAVDGHRLWDALVKHSDVNLVAGWIIENYHYLASATKHVSSAIFACTDPMLRKLLIQHLVEEADHGEILAEVLYQAGIPNPANLRPLPSTVAFLGYLRELALTDWKAYILALVFLQRSLCSGDPRHADFYEKISRKGGPIQILAMAMQKHDQVDAGLDHFGQMTTLLNILQSRHQLSKETFQRAGMVPLLIWSFLEGIAKHYLDNSFSTIQRMGWRCA